jgi:hypothetical protein
VMVKGPRLSCVRIMPLSAVARKGKRLAVSITTKQCMIGAALRFSAEAVWRRGYPVLRIIGYEPVRPRICMG